MKKNILLGISGGIAAYKTPLIVRLFKKSGYNVRVVMTDNATKFVSELSLSTVSEFPVYKNMFGEITSHIDHVEIAKWADVFLIAPASANTIAKMAHGICDNLLLTTYLAFNGTIIVAPGMNDKMWESISTKENIKTLRDRNVLFIGPDEGFLACNSNGVGRMSSPEDIFEKTISLFNSDNQLYGKKILITAGATREFLDPARFISNPSSGNMGIALAATAMNLGANVTIIAGFITATPPFGVKVIHTKSTSDMLDQVMKNYENMDIVIFTAAVSDWTPVKYSENKIKKDENGEFLNLKLKRTTDILKSVGEKRKHNKPVLVGFSAETLSGDDLVKKARQKMERKKCDVIIANDISRSDIGFASNENEVYFISKESDIKFEKSSKSDISEKILFSLRTIMSDRENVIE